jgi:hypothetical protein
MTAYAVALDRMLPQVLTSMVQQNQIRSDIANRIMTAKSTWVQQFISSLPQGQITEQQFTQALMNTMLQLNNYYLQAANTNMFQPMNTFGGGGGGYSFPGNPNQNPFATTTAYSRLPGGNPLLGGAAPIDNSGGIVDAPGNIYAPRGADAPVVQAPVVTGQRMAKPEYLPAWKNDKSSIKVQTYEFGKSSVSEYAYPSDEDGKPFCLYIVDFTYALSTITEIRGLMKMVADGRRYLAKINHPVATFTPLLTDDLKKQVTAIHAIINKKGSNSSKLREIEKYLGNQTRAVYNVFERLIVELFNRCLATKMLQHRSNFNIGIKLKSLESIVEFIPGNNRVELDAIINVPNYVTVFDTVVTYILGYLENLEVSTNKEHIMQACKAHSGPDALTVYATILSGKEVPEDMMINSVLVASETTIITNMDPDNSDTIYECLDTELAVVFSKKTSAVDVLIQMLLTEPAPYKLVVGVDNVLYCGVTADQQLVVAQM